MIKNTLLICFLTLLLYEISDGYRYSLIDRELSLIGISSEWCERYDREIVKFDIRETGCSLEKFINDSK